MSNITFRKYNNNLLEDKQFLIDQYRDAKHIEYFGEENLNHIKIILSKDITLKNGVKIQKRLRRVSLGILNLKRYIRISIMKNHYGYGLEKEIMIITKQGIRKCSLILMMNISSI